MGTLTVPASGLVYVDANCVIYTVEGHPRYVPVLRPLWQASASGAIVVVSSELLLMETLIRPLQIGDVALQAAYERAMYGTDRRLLPITLDVLRTAARLRATTPAVKTPDAIHAATALQHGCALFVTNDTGFRRVSGLTVAVLDDVLAAP